MNQGFGSFHFEKHGHVPKQEEPTEDIVCAVTAPADVQVGPELTKDANNLHTGYVCVCFGYILGMLTELTQHPHHLRSRVCLAMYGYVRLCLTLFDYGRLC